MASRNDSTLFNLLRSFQTQQNMLGNEFTQIGRAIGEEEASAALNFANIGAVMALGAVAWMYGFHLDNKDKTVKDFFTKAEQFGGLGVPMDDTGAVLADSDILVKLKSKIGIGDGTMNRNEKKGFKTVYKSSYDTVIENIRKNQDTAVHRALTANNLWDSFLLCHQCNKNNLFFAVTGNWPPSFQINLCGVDPQEIAELKKTLAKCGVTMEASMAAGKDGFYNLGGDYDSLTKAAKALKGKTFNVEVKPDIFDDVSAADIITEHRDKHTLTLTTTADDSEMKLLMHYSKRFGGEFTELDTDLGVVDIGKADFKEFEKNMSLHGFEVKDLGDGKVSVKGSLLKIRNMNGASVGLADGAFDSIKKAIADGTLKVSYAFHNPTGFDGLMQLLFVANSRLSGVWGNGSGCDTIKQQIKTFAKTLQIDPRRAGLGLMYGEKRGAAIFERSLRSLVMDEEMAAMFDLDMRTEDGKPVHAFFDEKGNCKVTNLLNAEQHTEFARRQQEQLLAGLQDLLKNVPVAPEGSPTAFANGQLNNLIK